MQKLAETRGVFEESAESALVASARRSTSVKRNSPADTIFVILLQGRAYAAAWCSAVVEKREKRGKSMKSIRSHETSKRRRRDEKEEKENSKAEREKERGSGAIEREREGEGGREVRHAGRYTSTARVHPSCLRASIHQRRACRERVYVYTVYTPATHTHTHTDARTRLRAASSFPLKICGAIGSSSCSIILPFFLSGSSRCAHSRP